MIAAELLEICGSCNLKELHSTLDSAENQLIRQVPLDSCMSYGCCSLDNIGSRVSPGTDQQHDVTAGR